MKQAVWTLKNRNYLGKEKREAEKKKVRVKK
jgi:hypothetical protein